MDPGVSVWWDETKKMVELLSCELSIPMDKPPICHFSHNQARLQSSCDRFHHEFTSKKAGLVSELQSLAEAQDKLLAVERRDEDSEELKVTLHATHERLRQKAADIVEEHAINQKTELRKRLQAVQGIAREWTVYFSRSPEKASGLHLLGKLESRALAAEMQEWIDPNKQLVIPLERLQALIKATGGEAGISRLAELATALSMAESITFPWKKNFIDAHVDNMMRNLKEYKPVVDARSFRIKTKFRSGSFLPIEFQGRFTCFVVSAENREYLEMDVLADYFTEGPRMTARRKDQRLSPIEQWQDSGFVQRVFTAAIKAALNGSLRCPLDPSSSGLNSYVTRESVYSCVKECTQFKPSLARSVYMQLNATKVLDFSAGWGDRLLGAISCPNVVKYVAFDPNTTLKPGHTAMIERFVPLKDQKNYRITYEPAQTGALAEDEMFDVIFTSPPFFDFEVYTDLPGQSVDAFKNVDAWLVGFLFKCLGRFWPHLETGGYMAIHMSDDWEHSICEPMCLFGEAFLPRCQYCGIIASRGLRGVPRPIWVFRKMPEDEKNDRRQVAEVLLQKHYPKAHGMHINKNLNLKRNAEDSGEDRPVKSQRIGSTAADESRPGLDITLLRELNPPVVVSEHDVRGKMVSVIRDDVLVGGSKQRALDVFLAPEYDEYVYAGPTQGYAQIALSHVCKIFKKRAALFLPAQRDGRLHQLTQTAVGLGGEPHIVQPPNKLGDVQTAATEYALERGQTTRLLPFGLKSEDFIRTLAERLESAMPRHVHDRPPERLWLVAGSATLLSAIHRMWPKTFKLVVQVGKTIWPDQLEGIPNTVFIAPEKFWEDARRQPPYPSVRNYDAKLWQFVEEHGLDGDWIWNVGK